MKKSISKTRRSTKKNGALAKKANRNGKSVAHASETAVQIIRPLTAGVLKEVLWETLLDLRTEAIMPNRADAIAAQAREIIRTVKVQLQVAGQAKVPVSANVVKFAGS
jgi:hypothetical protein